MFIMMTSKTLLGKYLRDCTPKEFLERQYVIVSLNIRCTDAFKKNCVSLKTLYPNGYALSDYMNMKTKENFKVFRTEYRKQLFASEHTLGTLIEAMYGGGYDIVLLCTETDNKMNYMDILADFIEKRYGVPCVWYKEYRQHKVKELSKEDQRIALERAYAAQYDSGKKEFFKKFNGNQKFRTEAINNLSMDDKITLLKELGLYDKGMSKRDVNDVLYDQFQ